MKYIEKFEAELRKKLNSAESEDSLVRWICERILESFKNGITAGQNGETVRRQGQSRRRGSYGKAE